MGFKREHRLEEFPALGLSILVVGRDKRVQVSLSKAPEMRNVQCQEKAGLIFREKWG